MRTLATVHQYAVIFVLISSQCQTYNKRGDLRCDNRLRGGFELELIPRRPQLVRPHWVGISGARTKQAAHIAASTAMLRGAASGILMPFTARLMFRRFVLLTITKDGRESEEAADLWRVVWEKTKPEVRNWLHFDQRRPLIKVIVLWENGRYIYIFLFIFRLIFDVNSVHFTSVVCFKNNSWKC